MLFSLLNSILTTVLVFCFITPYASAEIPLDGNSILRKMESAYAAVEDYQTDVEVTTREGEGSLRTQKFRYTFKKPKWIRLDFVSPHPGAVLVYPDKNGKVGVRPGGMAHLLKFHLSPENPLIKVPPGQRIDQTDLGLLIKNISHSLTDQRRGPLEIEEKEYVRIRVSAVNHFQEGMVTLYQFFIDKNLWLPVMVEELTPGGQLERTIIFKTLKTNTGVSASFFQLD